MKKRIFAVIVTLVLCVSFCCVSLAEESSTTDFPQDYLSDVVEEDMLLNDGEPSVETDEIGEEQAQDGTMLPENGTGKDTPALYSPRQEKSSMSPIWIFISLAVGVGLAFTITGIMKGKLKTVYRQQAAENYVREGSMKMTDSRDMFLYKKVERTEKESSSSGENGNTASGKSQGSK